MTLVEHSEPPLSVLDNCTYRYDDAESTVLQTVTLVVDGPLTLCASLLSLFGSYFSVKFLHSAGLNRDLTAALYTLSICDAILMLSCVAYHSIEATSILLFRENFMWNHQDTVLVTFLATSAATTASTLLVVFITLQRFFVVTWPLKYGRPQQGNLRTEVSFRRCSNSFGDEKTRAASMRQMLSPVVIFQRKKSQHYCSIRPYALPLFVIVFSLAVNSTVFFEFNMSPCWSWVHKVKSTHLLPSDFRLSPSHAVFRVVIFMVTQNIGPIFAISFITAITEYKVYRSMQSRKRLFENQSRRKSAFLVEEARKKVSRAVAIFISVKFLILRSLPAFFDLYETIYGIHSFGTTMSILVRISDFGVVLNSATNSLAYFGRKQWLENRLKGRILRKHAGLMDERSNSQHSLIKKKSTQTTAATLTMSLSETGNDVIGVGNEV